MILGFCTEGNFEANNGNLYKPMHLEVEERKSKTASWLFIQSLTHLAKGGVSTRWPGVSRRTGGNLLQGNLQSWKTQSQITEICLRWKRRWHRKMVWPIFPGNFDAEAEEKVGGEERTTVGGKFNLEDKPTSYEKHNVQSFLRAFHVFFLVANTLHNSSSQ